MALYTSTPKSKRLIEEEVSLLSLNSENEGEHIYNHNIFFCLLRDSGPKKSADFYSKYLLAVLH